MFKQLMQALKGINAINVTPFTKELAIDWPSLQNNIAYLLEHHIQAIYPCGNTGEFYALTLEEAKEVTRFVTKQVAQRARVIAGVGYDAITASMMAKDAELAGADGIMIHQPVHPYILPAGVIAYYEQIAASTDLPIILYIRNEQITVEVIREIVKLPNVIGIKYAVNHLPSFTKAVQAVGHDIVWICGTAEIWAPYFYAAGAEGFTSGLVNVDTIRPFRMLHALQSGDYRQAMEVWAEIVAFEELRAKHNNGNNISVVKEAMFQLGLLPNNKVRPPISAISKEEASQVGAILQQWGRKE